MKRLTLILFCLFAGQIAYSQNDTILIKMMTYNIRHGAGMDDVVDLDRQAAVIQNALPDVVGLQEVDSVVKRSGYIPEAAILGNKVGMHATFGPAIPLTGGKYGVAILSKEVPLSVRNIPLPGEEKRTLLVCEFERYVFATTHLDLNDSCRTASLPIILEEVARWDKPFFICGDWNAEPSSTLIKTIKKSFNILNNLISNSANYTFPANNPKSIIDYIASSNRVVSRKPKVINEPNASDHRPVVVDVKFEVIATGIHSPSANSELMQDEEVYDLTGKKVENDRLTPGLYILKNSRKKVVIR